mgnify:CR=1 FL=1
MIMPDRRATLELNQRQKAYYESRFQAAGEDEAAANRVTNLWTRLRRRIQCNDLRIGIREAIQADHRGWLGDVSGTRVLDLGCFTGNELSLWLASQADEYVGMDLSEQAAAELQRKLDTEVASANARAVADDVLAGTLPAGHFDIVYAYSVLHHFRDTTMVLEELDRLLKPGGLVVSVDPLATEPLNRLARTLYRPFQSDSDWEWPFTYATFRALRRYFRIDRVQGYRGLSMLSLPLAALPFTGGLARRVGQAGVRMERRFANRTGPALWMCWIVSTRLIKPTDQETQQA